MHGFFVTSSGTEIGKTWVMRCLIAALRARPMNVRAIKPLISGWVDTSPQDSDTAHILEALDQPITDASIDTVSPWRFAAALSPDMAAQREGRSIDFGALTSFCRNAATDGDEVLLIEGVGGVMVPLNDTHTVLDWIRALELPAILVVGSYLGTISHTLTSYAALRAHNVPVPLVVVNDTGDAPVPLQETRATLTRFMPTTTILTLPRRNDGLINGPDGARLANELI